MDLNSTPYSHDYLVRKLNATTKLTDEETQAFLDLPIVVRELEADQDIVRIGDVPSHCSFLLEGWACRYKLATEGNRQIMSFHWRAT